MVSAVDSCFPRLTVLNQHLASMPSSRESATLKRSQHSRPTPRLIDSTSLLSPMSAPSAADASASSGVTPAQLHQSLLQYLTQLQQAGSASAKEAGIVDVEPLAVAIELISEATGVKYDPKEKVRGDTTTRGGSDNKARGFVRVLGEESPRSRSSRISMADSW